jgi:hypothetical protein
MRDQSRFSRRDVDEAFGELKQIARAGVAVWFYQDQAPFAFGTFGDNVVGYVKAEAAADYRRQIARWTTEAMERKARAGHITGGRVFGYARNHLRHAVNRPEKPTRDVWRGVLCRVRRQSRLHCVGARERALSIPTCVHPTRASSSSGERALHSTPATHARKAIAAEAAGSESAFQGGADAALGRVRGARAPTSCTQLEPACVVKADHRCCRTKVERRREGAVRLKPDTTTPNLKSSIYNLKFHRQ